MEIMAFMKPKVEVVFVFDDQTIREAMEKMEKFRFTSIPIIHREGFYVGTLTEGDLLWEIKNAAKFDMKKAEAYPVGKVRRFRDYEPIHLSANIDELIIKASNENFVPVIDSHDQFVGIVTRKTLLNYFFEHNFIVL
ncbi:MAG TPA: CBS domain-containing protein [Candidatus Izemoplasmatales bacterium]|nr:CBS domain-containing protein [Bacillota bacterium]HRY78190.1 CBS domain-containing protein [Candidatus Izemoplasmatales bacterium]